MEAKGYSYSEVKVDGQTLGTWSKSPKPTQQTSEVKKATPIASNVVKFEGESYTVSDNFISIDIIDSKGKKAPGDFSDKNSVFAKVYDLFKKQQDSGVETITYTPKGKQRQTYTVKDNKFFNSKGVEVFKEDSSDRNKLSANLAIKRGEAEVVEHDGKKYVVNRSNKIMSVTTGKIMQWSEENGNRKAILSKTKKSQQKVGGKIVNKVYEKIDNDSYSIDLNYKGRSYSMVISRDGEIIDPEYYDPKTLKDVSVIPESFFLSPEDIKNIFLEIEQLTQQTSRVETIKDAQWKKFKENKEISRYMSNKILKKINRYRRSIIS